MTNEKRIHIKPTDHMFDVDEIADGSEPRSRCRYFIEPYGPHEINEVGEANYYIGNRVPYHEHTKGYETFLVDGGSFEVLSRSRKAIARKGDLVHIQPYIPHSIHALEDNSIWRAFHQGLSLHQHIWVERRVRDTYPEIYNDPDFKKELTTRGQMSIWYKYEIPECVEIPVSKFPEIRAFDESLAEFDHNGLTLKLKIGRWETNGAKEVWQIHMKSGCNLSWTPINSLPLLFDVYDGTVEVKLDGMDAFTADARDLLHIPRHLGGSITAKKDTILFDTGCQGNLMRYLDEINTYKTRDPKKLKDEQYLQRLMKKNNYHIKFELE